LASDKACSDVNSLTEAYQMVIDKYSLTNIDLDIEGDDLGDIPAEHRRFQAVKTLKERAKAKGKDLFVTLTLPATTVGLSDLARDEIRRAVTDGVVIDLYKVM
jgi:chitinase